MVIDFLLDDIRKAIADIESEVSGLTGDAFASVDYVSSAKTIYFYNANNEAVGSIDTTDFVVDGMIDTVSLSGNVLHFVFNTDAGKQPIDVDLSSIMPALDEYWTSAETKTYVDSAVSGIDLSNYYTKAETDSAITAVEDHLYDVEEVTASALTELHDNVLELSARTVDLSGYYTSGETDAAIAAAVAPYYTSAQTDTKIAQVVADYTPTSGFSTINGSAITNGGNIVIQGGGGDMSAYWTSAQTEDAISAATAGKANALNVTASTGGNIPKWNTQGVINGIWKGINEQTLWIDNNGYRFYSSEGFSPRFYAPKTSGETGQIIYSDGTAAPKWVTPATINGSAITNGGNIVIQGGGDMSAYWTSAETKSYVDSAITEVQDQIDTVDEVVSQALVDLNTRKVESTSVSTIWKGTQAEYDAATQSGATANPATLYIIVNNS